MSDRVPSRVELRVACGADADPLAVLLGHLGYPSNAELLPARLEAMRAAGDEAIVATIGDTVVGLVTLHRRIVLHSATPVAQLTALVVPPDLRRRGIGQLLVAEAERWARAGGAGRLIVTTATHRAEAPAFYERLGFRRTGGRFAKELD